MRRFTKHCVLPLLGAFEMAAILEFLLFLFQPLLFRDYPVSQPTRRYGIQLPLLEYDQLYQPPTYHYFFIVGLFVIFFAVLYLLFQACRNKYPRWLASFFLNLQILPVLSFVIYSSFYQCSEYLYRQVLGSAFCLSPLSNQENWSRILIGLLAALLISTILIAFLFRKRVSMLVRLAEWATLVGVCLPFLITIYNVLFNFWHDSRLNCQYVQVNPKDSSEKLKQVCPSFWYKVRFVYDNLTLSNTVLRAKYPYR